MAQKNKQGQNQVLSNNFIFCNTNIHQIKPYTPNQNFAQTMIGWLKKRWKNQMKTSNIPSFLWDDGLTYEAKLMSLIAGSYNDRTGKEKITGETPDIFEYLDYGFYD